MHKSLAAVILTSSLLIATIAGTCYGENLFVGGGFENTRTGTFVPPGWQLNTSRNTEVEAGIDATMKHSGSNSCKIEIDPPGGQVTFSSTDYSFNRKPEPGKSYRLSFWINARNLDYNNFRVTPAVRFDFKPTRLRPAPTIDLMSTMRGVSGWKELSIEAEAPEGAEEFYLDFLLTKGTVWIDDISVTPIN